MNNQANKNQTGNKANTASKELTAQQLIDKQAKELRVKTQEEFNATFKSFSKLYKFIEKRVDNISKGWSIPVEFLTIEKIATAVNSVKQAKKDSSILKVNDKLNALQQKSIELINKKEDNSDVLKAINRAIKSKELLTAKDAKDFYMAFSLNSTLKAVKTINNL